MNYKRQTISSSDSLEAILPSSTSALTETLIPTTSAVVQSSTTTPGLLGPITSLLPFSSSSSTSILPTTSSTTATPTLTSALTSSTDSLTSSSTSSLSSSTSSGALASATQSTSSKGSSNNLGAILGGSIGGAAGLLVIFVLVKWWLSRREREQAVEWYAFGDGADKYKPLGGGAGGAHQLRDPNSHPTYQDDQEVYYENSDPWSSRAPELDQGTYQDHQYQDAGFSSGDHQSQSGAYGVPVRGMSTNSHRAPSISASQQYYPQSSVGGYGHQPNQSVNSLNGIQYPPYSDNASLYSHSQVQPQYAAPGPYRSESPGHYQ